MINIGIDVGKSRHCASVLDDRTGEWIGRSRHLRLELDDVYFEWGREAVGWARGSWKGLYDPETGMVRLPDETYRLLLKAKIGANRWDGTVPGAYEVVFTYRSGSTESHTRQIVVVE